MISFQQIQYIIAVAEERQFQRASERCFVTQPTLSMQVKKAEETLSHLIFDRSRSPLTLTNYGEQLLPILRDILSEYGKIEVLTKKRNGTFKEQIKIAVIPTIAGYMIPSLYQKWRGVLKDVDLVIEEMKTEEIIVALEEKSIDLGILAGPLHRSKWRTSVLYQEEICVYAPHLGKKIVTPAELEEYHPWLLTKGNCLRTQMIHFCELNNQKTSNWNYEGGNIELLVKMVDLHKGYTLIPSNYLDLLGLNESTRIQSEKLKEFPAREIIAVCSNRSPKWSSMEKLIREIQLNYNTENTGNLKLLKWD